MSKKSLTVLHLSDPQFGRNHRAASGLTEADRDRDSLFARLHEDLAKLARERNLRPDLVVVTGDLAEWGLSSEFKQALEFLERLVEAVELPRHRVAIVPGNHDLNRSACRGYFEDQAADEQEPQPPYWPKWRHYAAAFDRFYAGVASPEQSSSTAFTGRRIFRIVDLDALVTGRVGDGAVVLYGRVSSRSQQAEGDLDRQVATLCEAATGRVVAGQFTDVASLSGRLYGQRSARARRVRASVVTAVQTVQTGQP